MKETKGNISAYRSIAVVDMDGTLVSLNTWKPFAKLVLCKALKRAKIFSGASCVFMLLLRKGGMVSHRRVKKHIMLHSYTVLKESDLIEFASDMSRHFNPEVIRLIDEARGEGALVVLASAAAGEYVPYIAERAGISSVFSTPRAKRGVEYLECRGERKAEEIDKLSQQLGLPVSLIVTDHPDDFPLFEKFPEARHVLVKSNTN